METVGSSVLAGYFPDYIINFMDELDEHPWLFSSLASVLVGLSGILPLLIIPIDETANFNDGREYRVLFTLKTFYKRLDKHVCFFIHFWNA